MDRAMYRKLEINRIARIVQLTFWEVYEKRN